MDRLCSNTDATDFLATERRNSSAVDAARDLLSHFPSGRKAVNLIEAETVNRARLRAAAAEERRGHRPRPASEPPRRQAMAAEVKRGQRPKLDTGKAARHCGLGHSTLVKYRVFGGGPPFFKLGRRVVYDPDDLDEWMEARRRVSTSDTGTPG
jgi:hypothetical protein